MKYCLQLSLLFILLNITTSTCKSTIFYGDSSNYTNYIKSLVAGDTLILSSGNYQRNLTLNKLQGTKGKPIVISGNGNSTVFQGQSCCNTISITQCAFLVIKNIKLDGMFQLIDAVKAEGTIDNWAHDITIEYLTIANYGASQQNVGISTKCPAWNFIIRKNRIIGAGTGMYLGNSDGTKPFVDGVIEYNYIANTIGYNIEIKHQFNGQRELLPGTSVNGKTVIRHNVFTKDESSSSGVNARPNVLVGGFPTIGWGKDDYYEIYGNFFYNNPVEALFQGTGNIIMYANIFVNNFDPSGFRAVYFTPQNGVSPQNIKVFHNTIWTANTTGGIRLYNPNANYRQSCSANAVFSALPITNFTDTLNNVSDSYLKANTYLISPSASIESLNLYPLNGQLKGFQTSDSLLHNFTEWNRDFNDEEFNWEYKGAYSGCCKNMGWKLQLDTMSFSKSTTTVKLPDPEPEISVFPNPTTDILNIRVSSSTQKIINIYSITGENIYSKKINNLQENIDISSIPSGVYFLNITSGTTNFYKKIIK